MTSLRTIIDLSVEVAGGLPTEFRLFVAGWNDTEKGRFLFDDVAARSVMAAYEAWGIDLPIDLEHQMMDPVPSADPTARDARGWANLAVKPDGSLWAVNVRWTEDGAQRLSQKRQRYVSPTFEIDEAGRVTKVINVAITALPATHRTPALVAASVTGGGMDKDLVMKALDALESGDAKGALEILKGLIAAAASGDADAATEDAPPPAGDGGADEATETMAAAPPPPAEEEDPTKKAVAASLCRLTGRDSYADALAVVETWKASHVELTKREQAIADEKAALEAADRRKLVAELVTLGAEFPSTVWADPMKPGAMKPRWQNMPIEELRAHVGEQRAARAGTRPVAASAPRPTPAPADGMTFSTPHGVVTLTASEIAECQRAGAKPEVYAANKAQRAARRGGNGR